MGVHIERNKIDNVKKVIKNNIDNVADIFLLSQAPKGVKPKCRLYRSGNIGINHHKN